MKRIITIAATLACPALLLAEARPTDDGVVFTLDASQFEPRPAGVSVAGSFNGWNSGATPMADPENDGTWAAVVPLGDGAHEYKFVLNGGHLDHRPDRRPGAARRRQLRRPEQRRHRRPRH